MKRRTHWPGLPRTVGNHQRPYRTRNAPRASQACRACAAAKAKCDNDRHCKRCRKRGIRCERAFPVRGDTGCSEGDAECHDTAHHSLSDGLTVDVPSMFDASTFTTEAQAQDMGLLNISNSSKEDPTTSS